MNGVEGNRLQIALTAREMISGNRDMLEGIRDIVALSSSLPEHEDPMFYGFRAVESEAEDIPAQQQRHLYSKEYLADRDASWAKYSAEVRGSIIAGCEVLISRYAPDREPS